MATEFKKIVHLKEFPNLQSGIDFMANYSKPHYFLVRGEGYDVWFSPDGVKSETLWKEKGGCVKHDFDLNIIESQIEVDSSLFSDGKFCSEDNLLFLYKND